MANEPLAAASAAARACTRCPALVASRTQVVAGVGSETADVVLIAGAPGAAEDAIDAPLGGRGARLLDRALGAAGLGREDVWTTTLVKCLPPSARDPTPVEVATCSEHLVAELEALRPIVVVALGAFVTKLLRGSPQPIRELRGREEPLRLGGVAFWLLPVFDPAAALYATPLEEQLTADLGRLPELIARGRPELDAPVVEPPPPEPVPGPGQLGLF